MVESVLMSSEKDRLARGVIKLDRVAVSRIVALIAVIVGGAFIAGYFLGKRQAVVQELDRIHKRTFADQVTYALGPAPYMPAPEEPVKAPAAQQTMSMEQPSTHDGADQDNNHEQKEDVDMVPHALYYAPVLGGTKAQVEQFAQRMRQRSIPIKVQKRTGTTASGKPMTWYQAVTESYQNQEELNKIIAVIKKTEHIKDITVIMSVPAQKGTRI